MHNTTFSNKVQIPSIGLGVFCSEEGEETINAVKWALECGYRHIDTAMIYGNEHSVYEGIRQSEVPREEIFITTKLWNKDIRQKTIQQAFEKSLNQLQTNYIDLYLIHWPAKGYQQAWRELENIYHEKKVKAIGVSNFHQHHLQEIFKIADIKPMVNQIESHPMFNNQELINYCQQEEILVQAWSPLSGQGAPILTNTLITDIACIHKKTPAQIVLRWHLQRNIIVLPKSIHKERIISNFELFDFELSQEEMAIIQNINQNKRVGADPDNFDF